jgi:transposase InsO family protein
VKSTGDVLSSPPVGVGIRGVRSPRNINFTNRDNHDNSPDTRFLGAHVNGVPSSTPVRMVFDTGATDSSSPDPGIVDAMVNQRWRPGDRVLSSNGSVTEVPVSGTVQMRFATSRVSPHARSFPVPLPISMMHVPGSVAPLLSVSRTVDAVNDISASSGAKAIFDARGATVCDGRGRVVAKGPRIGNLYWMDAFPVLRAGASAVRFSRMRAAPVPVSAVQAAAQSISYGCLRTAKASDLPAWSHHSEADVVLASVRAEVMTQHFSMGHPSLQAMQQQVRRGASGISTAARRYLLSLTSLPCVACAKARLTKSSVPKLAAPRVLGHNQRDGGRIASDAAGPFVASRYKHYRYFVVFVHKRTRFSWVGFMRDRSEMFDLIKRQKLIWDAVLKEELVFFISDNAKEYTSEALRDWFLAEKVQQRFSCPDSSAQNGMAERYIRTLRERAHAMMAHSGVPGNLWAEAVRHANDVLNHTPRDSASGLTPHQHLMGSRMADVFRRRCVPFGSLVLSLLPDKQRVKFADKTRECIFLGISGEHKDGYRLLHMRTNQVVISRSFSVCVDVFPFSATNGVLRMPAQASPVVSRDLVKDITSQLPEGPALDRSLALGAGVDPVVDSGVSAAQRAPARRSSRVTARPFIFDGSAYKAAKAFERDQEVRNESKDSDASLFAQALYGSEPAIMQFAQRAVGDVPEPVSYRKARESQHWLPFWKPAVEEELRAHVKNETWYPEPVLRSSLPAHVKVIPTKWVFKVKTNNLNGQRVRYKGRLVARGDRQREDSYSETFAPTTRWATVRAFAAFANQHDLDLRQLDVTTAFLIPELPSHERVFIHPPDGVEGVPPGCVFELRKSLYGLKQAGRAWYGVLDTKLKSLGFVPSFADPCLYIRRRGGRTCMVLTYVDDILLAGSTADVADITADLSKSFAMTDGGEPKTFLGVHFARDRVRRTITLSQHAYARDVLKRFGMQQCVPSDSPAPSKRLSAKDSPQNEEERAAMKKFPYRAAVGALLYLSTATRPDLAQAVSQVARFCENPGPQHWNAVLRIFRYLAGTVTRGLTYHHNPSFSLFGYADADDAGCPDTRKSTSGFLFMYGSAPVSWKSKMQQFTTLSSCESEVVALSMAAREAVWLRGLFAEMYDTDLLPTVIFEDNDGARRLANYPRFSERSKHIERKYFFVRERVQAQQVVVRRCDTSKMLADIFTKPLSRHVFRALVQKIQSGFVTPTDPDFL